MKASFLLTKVISKAEFFHLVQVFLLHSLSRGHVVQSVLQGAQLLDHVRETLLSRCDSFTNLVSIHGDEFRVILSRATSIHVVLVRRAPRIGGGLFGARAHRPSGSLW